MSAKTCKHCGCSEIDVDQARGDAVCTQCGSVLEDNFIVSEVQFEENARGGSSSVGVFISSDGGSHRGFGNGSHFNIVQEARKVTFDKGLKTITEVAHQLRLSQDCITTAFRFFKQAVQNGVTKGRKHGNVVAACLYIACRIKQTPHMLLDFCDALQVNVYSLGNTYLRLSRTLCIQFPLIDPCLYIGRFAHHLQFGDKTHLVTMTASRLVQRMKRDWMHTGRRPSGLCGAALLVAARMHEFNRSMEDIIKVVKVCTATLRKRLMEFGETPSSRLTFEEFMTVDLEEEQDPPAFKAARVKARNQLTEDQSKLDNATEEISELKKEIERLLEEKNNRYKGMHAKSAAMLEDLLPNDKEADDANDCAVQFVVDETIESISEFIKGSGKNSNGAGTESEALVDEGALGSPTKHNLDAKGLGSFNWRSPIRGLGPTAASLGIKDSLTDCLKDDSKSAEDDNGELDLTGLDDEELDCYIMSADEVKRKSELWHTINADYLKELQEKEEREAKEREEGIVVPEKKKRKVRKKNPIQANTAGEAIEMMLQEKRLSNKINYDVLRNFKINVGSPKLNATTETTSSSLTPKSVSFSLPVSETLNRLQDPIQTTEKPQDNRKRKREDEPPVTPEKQAVPDVVIESGPVSYEPTGKDAEMDEDFDEDDYIDDDDDDGDPNPGASYIRQQIRGDDDADADCGYGHDDDYYD